MTSFALSFAALLFVTALFPFVPASVLQGSSAPSCYTCPHKDDGGFHLSDHNEYDGVLFCSYPARLEEDHGDFFCKYKASTGVLIQDNDDNLCPYNAHKSSCYRSRGDEFEAVKRRVEARAAQPLSSRSDGGNTLVKKRAN